MGVIIGVVLGALALFGIFWLWRFHRDGKFAISRFQKGNCIVAGHKGNGKDLFFSYVIDHRERGKEKAKHYANVQYTPLTEIRRVRDFNIDPNTYENFLSDRISQCKKTLEENRDYYLSDGGLYLPSTYQDQLVKRYPSLPLFYATQRHLLNSNFHVNVQNLPRLWDKLREQADYYFYCVQNIRIGKRTFIQKIRYYEHYEAAKANVLPFKVNMFLLFKDKRQLALKHQFEAQNGMVKYLYILNRLPKHHYDTRHFHKVIYGVPAPQKSKKGGKANGHHVEGNEETLRH